MDTKALMWIILGLILILGGVTASLKEGKRPAQAPSSSVSAQKNLPASFAADQNSRLTPTTTRSAADSGDKFDTGFQIDPIRGLRRKDQNQEYFK